MLKQRKVKENGNKSEDPGLTVTLEPNSDPTFGNPGAQLYAFSCISSLVDGVVNPQLLLAIHRCTRTLAETLYFTS